MVNSPSRPISRPADPPSPVEYGGMTPLWHREPSLPVHRTARFPPPAIKPNQTIPPPIQIFRVFRVFRGYPPPISEIRNPKSVSESIPIKAKTPVIVPNRASSRQTRNFLWSPAAIRYSPICVYPRPSAVSFPFPREIPSRGGAGRGALLSFNPIGASNSVFQMLNSTYTGRHALVAIA